MATNVSDVEPPVLARAVFGDRLPLAIRYEEWLVGEGVARGLIGPHEAVRIWQRHILNCVAVGALIPSASVVVDIGSGAGLPGLVLAIARPDIEVVLVESMLRRTTFLDEVIADLGISGNVSVRRARVEELHGKVPRADVVTARAVAPIDRLGVWAAPLLAPDGVVLAIKGDGVAGEVSAAWPALRRAGLGGVRLVSVAVNHLPPVPDGLAMPALRVVDLGVWNPDSAGVPFVGTDPARQPDADRLALVAILQRRPQRLSPVARRGLG